MYKIILYLLIGLTAGIVSGITGIGGGVIIVPALIFLLGMTQHQAQGTTLALLVPPIGLLAAYVYYRAGNVDLKVAGFICMGFFLGGYIGAKVASIISDLLLRRIFGILLFGIAIKLIIGK